MSGWVGGPAGATAIADSRQRGGGLLAAGFSKAGRVRRAVHTRVVVVAVVAPPCAMCDYSVAQDTVAVVPAVRHRCGGVRSLLVAGSTVGARAVKLYTVQLPPRPR